MGCLKSTKKFFLRMFCCIHRGRARDISIGRPTNFRKEDPYNSDLDPDLLALIREKAMADAHRMVAEPLLRDSINGNDNNNNNNISHDNHDVTTATAPARSSLRGKAKQQTHRLSLGLFAGSGGSGNEGGGRGGRGKEKEEEKEGLTQGASKINSSSDDASRFYRCNDCADSAHAGILRCGRGRGDGTEAEAEGEGSGLGLGLGLGFEAEPGSESDAEQTAMMGNTSASTSKYLLG